MGDEADDVLCSLTLSTEDLKKYDVVKDMHWHKKQGGWGDCSRPMFRKRATQPPWLNDSY